MTLNRNAAGALMLSLIFFLCIAASPATAQDQAQQQQQPSYTLAEYNAYQAAAKETNPQQKVKLLDDFIAKFPNSTLMPYVDQSYYSTYNELKNYPKVIEYADKLLGLGDKLDLGSRLQALYTRELAFNFSFNEKDPNAAAEAKQALDAAADGLKVLGQLPKPKEMTDQQFADQKKTPAALFNYTAGLAALQLKDYKTAENYFKEAIAANPNDGVTYFRLGVAYLQEAPPQSMDGFWALARSVALKGPGEAQVRAYLRNRLLLYEQPGCDNLVDAQMNEMIQLASTTTDRPAAFTIPSVDDLNQIRQKSNILSVLADLQGGGDKAKNTWLAVCGTEFPEVVGKVMETAPGADAVVLKVFTGATQSEIEKADTANEEINIEGQPDASRLEKDDVVRFSGTLASYDPQPFLLHWDKCKVNPEDIPPEKPEPGKRRRRPAHKPGH